jgi:hypothetical protein
MIAPSFGSYHEFLDRGLVLTGKLLSPWFPVTKWKSSLRKFRIASTSWLTATCHVCHKWPHIFSVCRSEALELSRVLFLVLVGFVLFMLCMLSTYMTSLVVMSGTMSAKKRRSNRLHSQFFCRWFICLCMLFVLCYVYWYPTRSHVVRVTVRLSPCLYWCWFVSLQI